VEKFPVPKEGEVRSNCAFIHYLHKKHSPKINAKDVDGIGSSAYRQSLKLGLLHGQCRQTPQDTTGKIYNSKFGG
jgi:hypothetical protein